MSSPSRLALCAFLFAFTLLAWTSVSGAMAQGTAASVAPTSAFAAPERQATLVGWRSRLHIAFRDRRHAYGGLFFDRGLLRPFTPGMDHEYDLDLATFAFTLQEDAAWYHAPNGFRTYMGSVSTSRFATRSHLRLTVPVRGRHTVRLDGVQREDAQAQRFFVAFGYDYRLGGAHRLGFTQTIAAYKPDLDFSLSYELGHLERGLARLEVTFLDVANGFIFDRLGVDPVLEDTVRSYRRKPRLFALHLASPPLGRFRTEIAAGVQPRARALVASQATPTRRFRFDDEASYVGALAEYHLPRVTLGLVYRQTRTSVARRPAAGGALTSDYASTQHEREAMLYALADVWRLRGEAWLARTTYTDRQRGTDFAEASIPVGLGFEERRLAAHLRLRYVPDGPGVLGGLGYLALHRRFPSGLGPMGRYLRFAPFAPNHRLSLQLGYRFTRHAVVVLGANADLDGDPFYGDGRGLTRYDGGFAQIALGW